MDKKINQMMRFSAVLFLAMLVLVASQAWTADRHVGSGQTYSTIASAIAASSSGDNIVIHEGTYNEYYLQPKSGTNLIGANRFSGTYSSELMPIIDSQQTTYHSSDNYDCIVLYPSKSNITIEGLYLKDGGRDCIRLTDAGCSNITIRYCKLEISSWIGYANDSAACIYIDPNSSTSGIIEYCEIISTVAGVHGIIGFRGTGNWIIRNNTITISGNGSGSKDSHGIFWKHNGTGANQFRVINNAIKVSGYSGNGGIWFVNDNTLIDNNLVYGSTIRYPLTIGGSMGVPGGSGSTITHNTVYGGVRAGVFMEDSYYAENTIWRNNIFVNTSSATEYSAFNLWVYGSGTHTATEDHNCIYHSGQSNHFKRYSASYNLSGWQALGYGSGTVVENPGFANGSGNLNTIADFEIISGNANNGGSDGHDMGCNVALVGASPGEDTPPTIRSGGIRSGGIR